MAQLKKCLITGKVRFSTSMEAEIVKLNLKWLSKHKRDEDGKRIKHRQGKPDQRRAYYSRHCHGYHLTKWKKSNYNSYIERKDGDTGWKGEHL